MKVNLILKNNIITGYTFFSEESTNPVLEIENPNKIHFGIDEFINGQLVVHEYHDYLFEIQKLKKLLEESDYKLLKYMDGELSEQEYLPIKEQRKNWRNQINELEKVIKKTRLNA